MSSEPLLVTGATGTIGTEVVRLLGETDSPVRAMTRHPERAAWMRELGVEVIEGDFLEPWTLDDAVEGVKRAFLLSPNVREMAEMQSNFVAAAERANVTHIVKLSAAGADPESSWDIARWHGEIEAAIEAATPEHTFIRPVSYMQNLLEDAETIRSEGVFRRATPRDARINVVDTRDVAAVAARSLRDSDHRGKTYKPTGPEPITFDHMASVISEVTDRTVEFQEVSPATAREFIIETGAPEWLADAMVGLQVAFGKGIADLSTDDVERITGTRPRTFEAFVRDHAEAFHIRVDRSPDRYSPVRQRRILSIVLSTRIHTRTRTSQRDCLFVETDDRGRTGVSGLYAAGRLALQPYQTIIVAGHGASVGVAVIEDSDVPFYHDWVAPEGYFTGRDRPLPPGVDTVGRNFVSGFAISGWRACECDYGRQYNRPRLICSQAVSARDVTVHGASTQYQRVVLSSVVPCRGVVYTVGCTFVEGFVIPG